MRVSSILLSVLALSGLLPFGKLDAAVLATEQQTAIGELLCETPKREHTADFEAIAIHRETEPYSFQVLPLLAVLTPAVEIPHYETRFVPTAIGYANDAEADSRSDFGTLAINAP